MSSQLTTGISNQGCGKRLGGSSSRGGAHAPQQGKLQVSVSLSISSAAHFGL